MNKVSFKTFKGETCTKQRVYDYLLEQDEPVDTLVIAKELDLSRVVVSTALGNLKKDGLVVSCKIGNSRALPHKWLIKPKNWVPQKLEDGILTTEEQIELNIPDLPDYALHMLGYNHLRLIPQRINVQEIRHHTGGGLTLKYNSSYGVANYDAF